jgi:hypothetical protein
MGLQQWRGKTMKAYFCRLVFGSTIYNIWKNKNALRHGNNHKGEAYKTNGGLRFGLFLKVNSRRHDKMDAFWMYF